MRLKIYTLYQNMRKNQERIPEVRSYDTVRPEQGYRIQLIVTCEFTRLMRGLIHTPPAWICNSQDLSG